MERGSNLKKKPLYGCLVQRRANQTTVAAAPDPPPLRPIFRQAEAPVNLWGADADGRVHFNAAAAAEPLRGGFDQAADIVEAFGENQGAEINQVVRQP